MIPVIKKIFAFLAKLFAKEFLWLIAVFILSIPLSILLSALSKHISFEKQSVHDGILLELKNSRMMCSAFFYILSFACIYFFRVVRSSLKIVLSKKVG